MGMYDYLGGYTTATGTKLQDMPDFLANTDVAASYAGPVNLNQNYNYDLQNKFAASNAWDQVSGGLMKAPASGGAALRANQAAQDNMGQIQGQDFARLGNQLGEVMKTEFGNVDSINKQQRFNTEQFNKAGLQTAKNRIQGLDWQRDAALDNWKRINADIAGRNMANYYGAAEQARQDNTIGGQWDNYWNPRVDTVKDWWNARF